MSQNCSSSTDSINSDDPSSSTDDHSTLSHSEESNIKIPQNKE